MGPDKDALERLIWATRGRYWGFRFLLKGGLSDPLLFYERSFADLEDEPAAYHRTADVVALRFPDPLGRRDASGRLIPHEFVVSGTLADRIESVADGLRQLWPLVAEAYARVWDIERPPSRTDLRPSPEGKPSADATDRLGPRDRPARSQPSRKRRRDARRERPG